MKISKLFSSGLLILFLPLGVSAQLSDRVNAPSTYTIGTRPEAGNYAVQIGSSYQDIQDILDDNKDFEALPIVTIKYYNSSKTVYTISFKTNKDRLSMNGTFDNVAKDEFKYVSNLSHFMIVPGFEKHYGQGNILDIYGGMRVPLGLERDNSKYLVGAISNSSSRNSLAYGLDAFVGFQAFIGDLPFAIGAEIDYSLLGRFGDKYKVVTEGGVGGKQVYYYTSVTNPVIDSFDNFEKLSVNSINIETDLRINLVYFFKQ